MPVLRSKTSGDMYIQVEVETPKNLTARQRELLQEFEKSSKGELTPPQTVSLPRWRASLATANQGLKGWRGPSSQTWS